MPHSALEPTTDRSRSGWDVLSLLRFFLAFIVALTHLKDYGSLGPLAWIEKLGSFEAILGFLLISGYSIGHSIQKRPEGYLLRRMWRIYPVYLAAVAITYAIEREPWTGTFTWHFLGNLFFLGQVIERESYVGPAWTLDLEVWLYCLAPLFMRLRGRTLEVLIGLSIFSYFGYSLARSLLHMPHYATTLGGINLLCLGFIWIAGFYLSTAREKMRPLKIAGLLLLAHLVITVGIQLVYRVKHHELNAFVSDDLSGFICNGLLLLFVFLVFRGVVTHRFHFSVAQSRVSRFLGNISYPLYLVHYAVLAWVACYLPDPFLMLLAALVVATAVYFCCDFYSMRRKLA